MPWFVPETAGTFTAPDFQLTASDGQPVTRSQFRQKKHLVLVFLPDPEMPNSQPLINALAAAHDELAQASAAVYLISAHEPADPLPLPLLIDPEGAVRQVYATLFHAALAPVSAAPADHDSFLVILNRYGVLEFAGRDLDNAASVTEDVVTRVWGLEYQCSL